MNILYISRLIGNPFAGPTYSIPKQIAAQSKIDNVFWYNAVKKDNKEWHNLPYYHNLNDYPSERIKDLPEPFNKPDLIIVETFYTMVKSKIILELISGDIPYVIVPRCELTERAQKRKWLKKSIANFLICKRYAKKALAIEYLTEQEKKDSGNKWNSNSIVIPNGMNATNRERMRLASGEIKCVSIGRLEPYQKGLDILIEACAMVKDKLKQKNCKISIYGPDVDGKVINLKNDVEKKGLSSIIQFYDGIYGEEKEECLLNSDVFLMPSRFEGHPMALIESCSYELPAVVSLGSNMKEEIEKYDAGWTSENTAESYAEALSKMLDQVSLHEMKGKNARELSKKYNWDAIAKKSHIEYEMLLKSL